MATDNRINNMFIAAIGAKTSPDNEILATFKNGRTIQFTTAIFQDLKTDPDLAYITNLDGELLYMA